MEEMQEYFNLRPCSCKNSQVVMMSENRCFGQCNGISLGHAAAYAVCKNCGKRTMTVVIEDRFDEANWHDVMHRAQRLWNENHCI